MSYIEWSVFLLKERCTIVKINKTMFIHTNKFIARTDKPPFSTLLSEALWHLTPPLILIPVSFVDADLGELSQR